MTTSLDEMLKIIRENPKEREATFKIAVGKKWYENNDVGRAQYFVDIGITAAPASPAPAPVTPPTSFADLPAEQKEMMIADLAQHPYLNRKAGNSLLVRGLGATALGAALLFGESAIPSESVDDTYIQKQIQIYKRNHSGKGPSDEAVDRLRENHTTNYEPWKNLLFWPGFATLLLGIGGCIAGGYKRRQK